MENKSRIFLLVYVTPPMKDGTIHHNIGTLEYIEASERIIPVTYKTPINVYQHVQGTLGIIR